MECCETSQIISSYSLYLSCNLVLCFQFSKESCTKFEVGILKSYTFYFWIRFRQSNGLNKSINAPPKHFYPLQVSSFLVMVTDITQHYTPETVLTFRKYIIKKSRYLAKNLFQKS